MNTDVIRSAYLSAVNRWQGCDWRTAFGRARLDLNGLKASQAILMARATSGAEAADWWAAARWLEEVERDVQKAAAEARTAAALAATGRLREALEHADRACDLEAKYHRQLTWQALRDALEAPLTATAGQDGEAPPLRSDAEKQWPAGPAR